MTSGSTANSIDEYIAGFPPGTQRALAEVRAVIKAAAPDAIETMSYAIPTFDLSGRHLVHFAGYERHVGFYPVASGIAAFKDDLKPYKRGKGSVQFPLDQPMPTELMRRIVTFRVAENLARASRRAASRRSSVRATKKRRSNLVVVGTRSIRRGKAAKGKSSSPGPETALNEVEEQSMKVYLLDGTYELFRSFYGPPPRKAPDGREVGATIGLLQSLVALLSDPEVTQPRVRF